MVSVNFTLVVELVLFLIFLWGVHRIAIRPLMATMDDRAQKIEDDRAAAETDQTASVRLTESYRTELGAARREASQSMEAARRKAMSERLQRINARKQELDQTVLEAEQAAEAAVEAERTKYSEHLDGLTKAVLNQLGTGGNA
jgi:F-type H+-transporting ATPase subunit b